MASPPKKLQKISEILGLCSLTDCDSPEDALGQVNIHLLACQSCQNMKQTTSTIQVLGTFVDRYLVISCKDCASEWCLCLECGPKQRTQIKTEKQMKDHSSNNHSNKKRCRQPEPAENLQADLTQDNIQDADNEFIDNVEAFMDFDNETSAEWIEVVNPKNLGFTERNSIKYFEQIQLGTSSTSGMKYLAMRSLRKDEFEAKEYSLVELPQGHAELSTRIAYLAFLLTRGQTETLVKVLDGSYKVGCENGFACAKRLIAKKISNQGPLLDSISFRQELVDQAAHPWSTRIPRTWNDVRQMYLEGARSIVKNLPTPQIQKDVPNHSYVMVADCIRHFLAHRDLSDISLIPRDDAQSSLEEIKHPSVSKRAREILDLCKEENTLASYVFFWSDDVEPNRMKANRGSVWLLTATIATPLDDDHCMQNTFPIAVGRKGEDHDKVIAKVEQEMKGLREGTLSPFFIGKQKQKVKMSFEVFCTLQDQPERRDFNSMRAGNAVTTGRFGVSADHGALYQSNSLPACKACLERMEKALLDRDHPWPLPPCSVCLRWDALEANNDLAFWVAPKDYPESENTRAFNKIVTEGGNQVTRRCLRPFPITYDTLKQAVEKAHRGYVYDGWSNQNCETFLEVEGLSTKYINVVMEHCARSYSYNLALQNPEKYRSIIRAQQLNPAKYQMAPLPTPWLRPTIPLCLHPDVIMHMVYLGVVKTTVSQIQNCLSAQSKLASFLKSTEMYLKEFQLMSIEWIPIQPYQGGKMGGWVSENFLGFSRILLWFFQNIDAAVESTTDFAPPDDLPQHKWLHRHNKYWLQVRGLDTKGNRAELKERVAQIMKNGAPEPKAAPEIPTASVEAVLRALAEVLQCVMAKAVTPALINRTRYAVRVFLSKYDSLCRPLRQKNPAVLSSYNFICLLNLPEAMERFGPLRKLWEGDYKGEGFAKFAKSFMTQGMRKDWHHMLLSRLHNAIAFKSVLLEDQRASTTVGLQHQNTLREKKGEFHQYKSAFDVQQKFGENRPLSERTPISVILVQVNDGEVKVLANVRDYDHVLEISIDSETDPMTRFGLTYYRFSVGNNHGVGWASVAVNVTRFGSGLLLPLMKEDDTLNHFALISSNWRSLSPAVQLSQLVD